VPAAAAAAPTRRERATTPHTGATAVEKDGTVTIAAATHGGLAYTATRATASAGSITFTMRNASGIEHNLAIQRGAKWTVLGATDTTSSGTDSISLELKPGSYTFFCQVNDHRAAGMSGTLTVQ
jgi:plastocyanin